MRQPGAPYPSPPQRTRAVSIRDVARVAGVSHQTVSRVVNHQQTVRASTREHVQKVIDDLGYRPNASARALAIGDTRSVTVLMSDTTRYGYLATLTGIEEAARAAGLSVGIVVIESSSTSDMRAAVERAVDVGGSLVVIAFDRMGKLALREIPPGVAIAAAVESPASSPPRGAPWCWIDDEAAARATTRYLLELGHETVHYVALASTTRSSRRTAGWRAALRDAGVEVPDPIQGTWGALSGYEAGRALSSDPSVTAVLCGNDEIALGVLSALHEARRQVPGDVSVAGFDDAPQSAYYTPSLTTTQLDFVALGRACVAMIVARLAGEPVEPHSVGKPELIVRQSTGPPRRC